jgi:D-amino-acid dehydrogenase
MIVAKSVVVVGGGIVGACTGYSLAKSGWRVTVVDRAEFGSGCSHGNCGYICPSHALPLASPGAVWSTLKTLFHRNSPLKLHIPSVLSRMGWFWNFARRCNERDMLASAKGISALLNSSRRLYDELLANEAIDCQWESKGLLFVFQSETAFDHYAEVDRLLAERFNLPAKRFNGDELLTLEPSLKPHVASGGWHYEGDAHLRPDVLMREMRRVLTKLGVEILERQPVTGFQIRDGQAIAVKTEQGEIPCDAAIVATGAWTPQLNQALGCRVPIVPGKGYSLTMPRPEICPTYPMIFEEHRVAVTPFRDGYRIGSTMEFAGYDETLNRDRLALLRQGAEFYLKTPTAEPVQEEWWGWRPMVYDGNPIIDFAPVAKNVLIAAGHGMLGLSMATGTGRLAAELLNGTTPHVDPKAYSLSRC